jgi:hypothetical protein
MRRGFLLNRRSLWQPRFDLGTTALRDLVALVEDGLLLGVWARDQVFGIIGVPQELVALKYPEVFGFWDERTMPLDMSSGHHICVTLHHAKTSGILLSAARFVLVSILV